MLEIVIFFVVLMFIGWLCSLRWTAHGWDWYFFAVLTLMFVFGGGWTSFFGALFIGWHTAREYSAR